MSVDSISSGLMMGAISYRNGNPNSVVRICLTELVLPTICGIAANEAVLATSCTLLSATILPITSSYFDSNVKWLKSSIFSVGWAATSLVNNLLRQTLADSEKSAKEHFISIIS